MNKPDNLCLAPWTHTYLSPQTERRMCCASREPAQNFQQYIDTSAGTGKYIPITLEEHWNSDHMRSVRRRMMAGETLPECDVCNHKLLNTSVYRDYFNHMFAGKREELLRDGGRQVVPGFSRQQQPPHGVRCTDVRHDRLERTRAIGGAASRRSLAHVADAGEQVHRVFERTVGKHERHDRRERPCRLTVRLRCFRPQEHVEQHVVVRVVG